MTVTACETQKPPSVDWMAQKHAMYTLTLMHIDNPGGPPFRIPFQNKVHWLVVNIPNNDVHRGDTIHRYTPASPYPMTGFHRFVFLLYKQPGGRVEVMQDKVTGRLSVHRTREGLGDPVAVSVFYLRWDASVDIMMMRKKQFGIPRHLISPFQMLVMNEVIPDVLPSIKVFPSLYLIVSYPEGYEFSNTVPFVPARVTSGMPELKWKAKAKSFYTVILVDPDFLLHQGSENRTYVHWFNTNIQGGIHHDPYRQYVGVAAPHGTGRHRYIFMLFEHQQKNQNLHVFDDGWAGV